MTFTVEEKYKAPREIEVASFRRMDHDVRLNPTMVRERCGYIFLILKKRGFVIGDYHTWLNYFDPQNGDTCKLYESVDDAQKAAYAHVQKELRNFADRLPHAFPTGKVVTFQLPCLQTSIV